MFNPYVLLAALAAFILSGVGGYWKGFSDADQRAQVAELQAALNGAYEDLNAQRLAAEMSRTTAEENRRIADEAQEQLDDYAEELNRRGADARCLLGPDDVNRLSKRAIGSDHAAPSRR